MLFLLSSFSSTSPRVGGLGVVDNSLTEVLPEYQEYKKMQQQQQLLSSTTLSSLLTSSSSSSSSSPLYATLSATLSTATASVATKPVIQTMYSDSLDVSGVGTGIGDLITSLCINVGGEGANSGCGSVWIWTRVFCYLAILLTILCGILYAIRSIYSLKSAITRQRNNNNNQTNDGQSTNRADPAHLSRDEQVLSRMLPGGPDPTATTSTTNSSAVDEFAESSSWPPPPPPPPIPYPRFDGGQSG
uniref:Uncharacterized protein n=1 Tax=Globodera rostochiensis TaxID=31243 RepID=A0A914GRR9_GLORO